MPTTAPTASTDPRLAHLLARVEIEDLVHGLGAALDDGTFDDLRRLLTDDVSASTPGGQAAGIDAVIGQAARNHDPEAAIQHLITDVVVHVDGDDATVRANLVVTFADRPDDPTPTRRQGSRYTFAARRTAAGWRLSRIATTPVWKHDEA